MPRHMKISTLTRRALLLAAIATFSTGAQSSASEIAMIKNIGGFYEKTGENIANYYLILSDNATAQWDHNAGLISMTGARLRPHFWTSMPHHAKQNLSLCPQAYSPRETEPNP